MGTLMVRCPRTGADFPSGIETDRLSFELTPAFTGTIRCPWCAAEHAWSKIDAWVCEIDGPSPPNAINPDPAPRFSACRPLPAPAPRKFPKASG